MGPTLTRSTAFSYNLGLSRDDDVEPLAVDELARLLCGVAAERAPGVAPVGVEAPLVLAALGLEHGTAPGRRDKHVKGDPVPVSVPVTVPVTVPGKSFGSSGLFGSYSITVFLF